jgi:cobalt-zinc-cadmium efflux system protein
MSRTLRLWIVLSLNLALIGVLVVVGISAHSIGVLAEGVDYLADAAAIGAALVALWLSKRPGSSVRPDGYPKATAIAAFINGGWLLGLSILVATSSVYRLVAGTPEVHGLPVLVVSAVAAVVMLIGALILGGDEDDDGDNEGADLAMRAVLLDTVADAATAAGVAISGGVIMAAHGLYWLDPAVALVIASIVSYHALALVRQSRMVLATPADSNRHEYPGGS